ncbi:MFS transporter [Rummeliibacillus sp. TYF005]|uniref:MDR family MFS transporter n=1 Tax=Rummeliibacillus sp. TYF005 TaxID=2058214 RepID=UPI000F5397BC|nr:MFS transporter [Rummeliibacillus sp. TYF005]RPJ96396.1 MFS transporter [Rummeliibacillus sp. TYF005]
MNIFQLPQNIKLRLITSFFNRMASNSVMPFMALFFTQEKNKIYAGIILVISVAVSFISGIIGGYLADRFKRKHLLYWTSTIAPTFLLIMTLCLIPEHRPIYLFAVIYLLFIFSNNLGRPALEAIILDSSTPKNRKAIYTLEYWLTNLSISLGAILGGLLYINHQILLFAILTIITYGISVAYFIWLEDEQVSVRKKTNDNMFIDLLQSYQTALMDKRFVQLVLGFMFVFTAERSLSSYISVRLKETFDTISIFNFEIEGVRMYSILNVENTLLVVCFTFLIANLTKSLSNKKILLIGLILYGIGYSLITSANNFFVLILLGFIATLGELLYSPVFNTEQANCIPEDQRGSYLAFSSLSFNGATLLSNASLILGAYLLPWQMSIWIAIIIFLGIFIMYHGLYYVKKREQFA